MKRSSPWPAILGASFGALLIGPYSLYALSNSRTYQVFGELIPRVETQERVVALTFDDGPTPGYTEQLLKTLDRYQVKASFYLVGEEIERNAAEARRIVEAGHEVGNHTYSHPRMVLKPFHFYRDQIEKTDSLIRAAGFAGPIFFRAPGCKKLFGLPYYLRETQRKHIIFDVEPDSYPSVATSSEKIVDFVIQRTRPGSIILLHAMYPSRKSSLDAVPGIIEGLSSRGYRFKTVSQLLAMAK